MNKKRLNLVRTIFVVFLPALLIFRLFIIQIWEHKIYSDNVNKQITSKIDIVIPRGDILDRNHRILATSIQCANVYVYSDAFLYAIKCLRPRDVEKNFETIKFLLNISKEELITKCTLYKRFTLVSQIDLAKAIELKRIPGIEVNIIQQRIYPYEPIANAIIGRIDKNGRGYSGIERSYNEILSNFWKKEINVYKSGKLSKLPIRMINLRDIKELTENYSNCSLVLTIDMVLQSRIYRLLENFYKIYSPKLIMCIVQKVDTGEILVMEVFPEKNIFFENPMVSYSYEPGSVFKIFPMAIFIEKNIVEPTTTIYCENGKFIYLGHEFSDVKPLGNLTVTDILVHSSNIGMVKLYLKYSNVKEFFHYLKLFGFGSLTGIELPSEVKGELHLPQSKIFSQLTPLNVSFGQGIGVTALQIVNGYTMIANNGYLLQPYIVNSIIDADNKEIYYGKKRILRKVISEETCNIIKNMMYQTVERGTAQKAKIDNVKLCAKTGTAQKFDFTIGKYSPTKYFMSCCGFFPLENPEFTIGVFVDEPKNARLASEVAVPLFKEVAKEIINYYGETSYAKAY